MTRRPIRLEPLALLLAIIGICMAVLAMLGLATAKADLALAEKHAETVRIRFELEEAGQRYLQEIEEETDTGIIEKEIEKDGYRLYIMIEKDEEDLLIRTWTISRIWEQDGYIEGLWEGK